MRRLLPALMCAAALTVAAPAAGQPAAASLYVELVINGVASGEILPLRIDGDAIYLEGAALRRAQIQIEGEGDVNVAATPGVKSRYNAALQQVELTVSPALLPISHIASRSAERVRTTSSVGALLNYDLFGIAGDGRMASLWSQQRVFGPLGLFSNDGIIASEAQPDGERGYRRYDTFARIIDEDNARTFTAGDYITQSLGWTRSVRMGGIQVSRAFRVRPDLVTMPLPSFAGETAVPSAVDLFVNGYRQQSMDATPGRFVLDSVPVVTGAGEAAIVTVDAVGRQIRTTIPFYVSADLLREGLSDFSFEAGFLRRNFGLKSFDYGAPAYSFTGRYGVTSDLTIEGHMEGTDQLRAAGAGVAFAPGRIGTFTASLSASDMNGRTGQRWSAGYEYTAPGFGLAYQHDELDENFRDLGDVESPGRLGRRSDRFVGSLNLGGRGSLAAAYIGEETWGGARTRLATATYQRGIGERATLLVSLDRDLDTGVQGGQVRLTLPLGQNSYGAAVNTSGDRTLTSAEYGRSMRSDGGLAIDAGLAVDQNGRSYGQGQLNLRGRFVETELGGAFADDEHSAWAGLTGSLVFMDGAVFAANQVADAFAVVSTGQEDVRVFYENQPVGKTGKDGRLLVPHVASYQPTTFGIDALTLDEGYVASSVSSQVAMREGAGAVIRIPVRAVRSMLVILVDGEGKHLEAGGRALRSDGAAADIGWDGLVYLEDVGLTVTLKVERPGGQSCTAYVVIPENTASLSKIGPVKCA